MAFNIGLSGIRAASNDLEVTGNNVANASTVGFKESRSEFGDVYTTTILGTGSKPVGSGVMVENVRQEFSQGNISGTESSLDMAIDGNGFFILDDNGGVSFTRAGMFGLDKDGFVVANNGARVQGFDANEDGLVSGVLGDLQIRITNQPPSLTSRVSSILNLDASELVLQEAGTRMVSSGLAIATPDSGIAQDTASTFLSMAQPTTAGVRTQYDFDSGGSIDWSNNALFTGSGPTAGVMGITIDPLDGTGAQTLAIPVVAAAASQTQFIADVLSAIQSELDTAFGNNEFEATTVPADLNTITLGGGAGNEVWFSLQRVGYDATASVGFSMTAPTGSWAATMGDPTGADVTITTGSSGSNLFVGTTPITADFRSVPGTPTTTRSVATPPLSITSTIPGSPASLVSTAGGTFDLSGANTLVFNIVVTDNTGTTNTYAVTLDNTTGGTPGATTLTEIETAITTAIGAGTDVVATEPPLTFTGSGTNPNGGTIALQPVTETGITLDNLGFATSNRLDVGVADIIANNIFNIQVVDSDNASNSSTAWDITIPDATYATLDDLAAAIQTEIDVYVGATGIADRVTVEAVGGQLLFTNTEVGDNFSVVLSQHTTHIPATEASSAYNALGFNNMFQILGTDEIDRTNSFRINLTIPAPDTDGRSGTATITLDEEFRSVSQLAASINRQIASLDADAYIGVQAEAIEVVPNVIPPEFQLQLVATETGEASIITVTDFVATGADITVDEMYGLLQVDEDTNQLTSGIEGVSNEYPETTVTIVDPDGNEVELTIPEDTEANEIASTFNQQPGITASATSTATIPLSGFNNPGNNITITLNGQALSTSTLTEMADEINEFTSTTLPGFSASINDDGDLIIDNSIGRDIIIEMSSPTATDSIVVYGDSTAGPVVLGGSTAGDPAVAIGGTIEFIFNEDYTLTNPDPLISGIFGALDDSEYEEYIINTFDPDDPETYNHATSTTVYDSLGNSHVMTQYFVKEPIDPTRPNEENLWAMYVLIDGQNVGDPDATLSFPENLEPTQARFELFFEPDGTLDISNTGDMFITNWDPIDTAGDATGALKSINVLEGGLPLTDPATSSNFQIFLDGSTQFGSSFGVNEVSQDGFTTGRLTGLEVDKDGFIFARFTNGQAKVLGQVALASFKNPEGLTPLGETAWGESFESGVPTIGAARTGTFGNLRASSLEDSNVNLSEELVGLIIAQRNFQASAKTIETSDTVTQTIIQL